MQTEHLIINDIVKDRPKIERAAALILAGELVGIPTETVYGLGANGLDADAAGRIFDVKGRPRDNPLIIHLAQMNDLDRYCINIPEAARILADRFWPGPMTLILERSELIPDIVTAGLSTVAVRFPDHPVARELIRIAKVPIAAPSANLSGKPSPTRAVHVINDLAGRIAAVLDAGPSRVGVESTIIDVSGKTARILRPGGITPQQIEEAIGSAELDTALFRPLGASEKPLAPGMKYRHYAPRAKVVIVRGEPGNVRDYVNEQPDRSAAVLCFSGEENLYTGKRTLAYGSETDYESLGENLFAALRELDCEDISVIYARCPRPEGVGIAVANRLLKAAGHEVVEV
ncbi:MAG: threonylcarbamoyl-AMP synthase [Clostridiales bacterium]|nr:threonylcarbamoyl-AMP synthase [Clostridiales bacterium]